VAVDEGVTVAPAVLVPLAVRLGVVDEEPDAERGGEPLRDAAAERETDAVLEGSPVREEEALAVGDGRRVAAGALTQLAVAPL
jgi:hypothetical protein